MLDWLYGAAQDSLTFPQTVDLFLASHRFDITELQLQCEQALKACLNWETFPQLEELAAVYCCEVLEQVSASHDTCFSSVFCPHCTA